MGEELESMLRSNSIATLTNPDIAGSTARILESKIGIPEEMLKQQMSGRCQARILPNQNLHQSALLEIRVERRPALAGRTTAARCG